MSSLRSVGTSEPEIVRATLYRYALPLAHPLPLRSGVTASERSGWVVVLRGPNSAEGFGEIAPLVFDHAALAAVESELIEALDQYIDGRRQAREKPVDEPLDRRFDPVISFGLSAAIADLGAATSRAPLHKHLATDAADTVAVNMLVDDGNPERRVSRGLAAGFQCFKVKVGRRPVDEDIDRVNRVHETILGRASLRLDANRAWTMAEACRFADGIADVALDYIEEPLDEHERLEELYYRTGWPIALDETLGDILRQGREERIGRMSGFLVAAVLKPSQLGNMATVLDLAERLRRADLRVTVSSSLESVVGRRTLLALAATPTLSSEPAGLATGHLYSMDLSDCSWSDAAVVDVDAVMSRPVTLNDDLLTIVKKWS